MSEGQISYLNNVVAMLQRELQNQRTILKQMHELVAQHSNRIADLESDVADNMEPALSESEPIKPTPPALRLKRGFAGKAAVAKGDELLTDYLPMNEAKEALEAERAKALN